MFPNNLKPCLKWVGGKRQLLSDLSPLVPSFDTYCEPFFGGGAMCFALQPTKAVINDSNTELINVYECVKTQVDELIEDLKKHRNDADYFYAIRALDRDDEKYAKLTSIQRASRLIYLNKTCFNGLYRVNRAGQFNSPFGKRKNPNIVDEDCLRALSKYFNENDVEIMSGDYRDALKKLPVQNSFVYLDPPYDPVNDTSSFTRYTADGFNRDNQIELKETCDKLTENGVKFMLSNSATDFILDLYQNYNIKIVQAKRVINAKGDKRGAVDEVVVTNY